MLMSVKVELNEEFRVVRRVVGSLTRPEELPAVERGFMRTMQVLYPSEDGNRLGFELVEEEAFMAAGSPGQSPLPGPEGQGSPETA